MSGTHMQAEILSQPQMWREAAQVASQMSDVLPKSGERVAAVGCGTSAFISQAYALLREEAGQGYTDWFVASEWPGTREYDVVVAITRSGTTTEVLDLLKELKGKVRTVAIVGDVDSPAVELADETVKLPFADEQSVVQTRFASSTLALLRASIGQDIEPIAAAAEEAIHWEASADVVDRGQFTFLATGWALGLAHEAALKLREAAITWSESYPAMDYRHGPMSITDQNSVVTFLGERPEGLVERVEELGGLAQYWDEDPQVTLVRCHLLALAKGRSKGQDPDVPRNLTRSVVLEEA